jgi:predicted AAA+ superfamily ATPase
LHYWQTRSRVEVDFIVYGESGLYAVEVKSSRQVRPEDLRALENFSEEYPQCRRYLLYRGKERLKRNGVMCLPCEEFLLALTPDHFPEQIATPMPSPRRFVSTATVVATPM